MPDLTGAAVAAFVVAFLLGSIPFGLIVSKLFFKTDIRQHGSGNIGTTNAIRTMGKAVGYVVFLLDFGKGLLAGFASLLIGQAFLRLQGYDAAADGLFAVLAPFGFGPEGDPSSVAVYFAETLLALAFFGCICGHVFSPWLRFKGGKGVAVAVGCVFVAFGVVGACLELAIFAALMFATRYVSVGSIVAAAACPFCGLLFFWGNWLAVFFCALGGLTMVWAHRGNIRRLLAGTEPRIGSRPKGA